MTTASPSRRLDERGVALVLAIFALVVIGALIAAVFFTAELEQRTATNTMSGQQAAEAAQAGLEYAAATWNPSWAQQGVGVTTGTGFTEMGETGGYFSDSVTPLSGYILIVRSFGQARDGGGHLLASRTAGLLFKLSAPDLGVAAGVTVSGTSGLTGSASVTGNDAVPSGGAWSGTCSGYATHVQPGVRSDGSVTVGGSATVTPSKSESDPSVATTLAKVNALFSTLQSLATITVSSAPTGIGPILTAGHACATGSGNPSNWGDPTYTTAGTFGSTHPCASYFPIIYASGDLTLSDSAGQGLLLVNGNLTLGSNAKFYGLVIVRGHVTGNGNGKIYGGLVAEDQDLGTTSFGGNFQLIYSSCAVATATKAAATGHPFAQRGFIQF